MRAVLAAALLLAATMPAGGVSTQETLLDIAAFHGAGGSLANLTQPDVVIEILDLTTGTRYATDDPSTDQYICRSGDPDDVCVPPGGDAFVPSEKNRATVVFQPGEWNVGDHVEVVVRFAGNATRGAGTIALAEGGVRLDVVLVKPPDSISLVVLPSLRMLAPDAAATFQVRVTNDRPFPDVIDLRLATGPPSGWTATFQVQSAALEPGETLATTLVIDTPPPTQTPYAGGTHNPAYSYVLVVATPRGAPALAQQRIAGVFVPMTVELDVDAPMPLHTFDRCLRLAARPTPCFVDPTQRVAYDVLARFAGGSPAAGARIDVDFARAIPGPSLVTTTRVAVVADDEGRARVEMPYTIPGLPVGVNLPGRYTVTATANLHDLRGVGTTSFVVGPVDPS